MVSSCAILLGGLLQRYAAINDRLRSMVRERFDLARSVHLAPGSSMPEGVDPFGVERFRELDAQMPDLLRRHQLVHNSVLTVYSVIAVFVGDMFVIAVAASSGSALVATGALIVFLAGTAVLLVGVLLTAVEVRTSHRAVSYEAERVSSLFKL